MTRWCALAATIVAMIAAACSGGSSDNGGADANDDPFAIVLFDAGVEASVPTCDVGKAFDSVTQVAFVGAHVRLSGDSLTAYLDYRPDGGAHEIYDSTRASTTAAFSPIQSVSQLTIGSLQQYASVTSDNLTIYFESVAPSGVGIGDIWLASRMSTSLPFGTPTLVPALNTIADDADPFIRADGQALYWVSNVFGNYDLFWALKTGNNFTMAYPITELNTYAEEVSPTVTADGLVIYFGTARNDADSGAKGGDDIWVASRATTNDTFGTPRAVTELNSIGSDRPSFISADRCTLYFDSNNVTYVATKKL